MRKLIQYGNETILQNETEVPYLAFRSLLSFPKLKHGYSTRCGGVSSGYFSSMNLGFLRGDTEENVRDNYKRICKSIGISEKALVFTRQTHETNIYAVTKNDCGKGLYRERDYDRVDGLITNQKGVALTVFGSDCVPLFLYDAEKEAIGVAHAGWKGTCMGMAKHVVQAMIQEYHTDSKDLHVVIGPSICKSCYEVGEDVYRQFDYENPKDTNKVFERSDKEGKYLFDLWKANELQLLSLLIPKEQIAIAGVCTCCNPDTMFSHRVMGADRGSLAGFLMMEE